MFLVGGALADRFGFKPLIVAGCALRTVGFGALAFAQSLPVLIAASAATGLAGALFNPAVRAYLAAEAGERRVEAFALFHTYYQAGILLGPLVGVALTGVSFRLTCTVAALLFALLTLVQLRHLPARTKAAAAEAEGGGRGQFRAVLANRSFWLFSLAMTGSYVLSFQVYLALPLAADGTAATTALFVVSALVTLGGQLRITDWCKRRLTRSRCLVLGLGLMGAAFLLPAALPGPAGALLCAAVLAVANAVLYPYEMDTVVALARNRRVATHYGLYNTVCGVGITLGNLGTGVLLDATGVGSPLPWLVMCAVGAGCAGAVALLSRGGHLATAEPKEEAAVGAGG